MQREEGGSQRILPLYQVVFTEGREGSEIVLISQIDHFLSAYTDRVTEALNSVEFIRSLPIFAMFWTPEKVFPYSIYFGLYIEGDAAKGNF